MALHELSQKELERKIKEAKDKGGITKIADGENLYLTVRKDGGTSWQLNFRLNGERLTYSLGTYPKVTLATARELAQEAREKVLRGENPVRVRKVTNAIAIDKMTVKDVLDDWLSRHQGEWGNTHYDDILKASKRDILPFIGSKYISHITPADIRILLERVESRNANYQLTRVRSILNRVFEDAFDSEKITANPVARVKRAAFTSHVEGHHPALTAPKDLAELLKKLDKEMSTVPVIALRLNALVFVRPQNLRFGTWEQINFKEKTWEVPFDQMKMDRAFLVPLSNQAIELLANLKTITGPTGLLFPNNKDKPLGDTTLMKNLHRLGYKGKHSTHGFRTTAKTLLEEGGFDSKYTEKQLAHEIENKVDRAYNRAEYWSARIEMMQAWADYLDALRLSESDKMLAPWTWFANWRAERSSSQSLDQPS